MVEEWAEGNFHSPVFQFGCLADIWPARFAVPERSDGHFICWDTPRKKIRSDGIGSIHSQAGIFVEIRVPGDVHMSDAAIPDSRHRMFENEQGIANNKRIILAKENDIGAHLAR